MDLRLTGKRALVTGATKGIGLAVARTLVQEGAVVGLVARSTGPLSELADELRTAGGQAHAIPGDLGTLKGVEGVVDAARAALGEIEILVNSAGAAARIDPFTGPDEAFVDAMHLKFLSCVRLVRAVSPEMVERRSGRIVNLIGVGGMQPIDIHLAGGAANAALINFTKGFGRLLARNQVLMNGVSPGAVTSERTIEHWRARAEFEGTTFEQVRTQAMIETPVGHEAAPDEIADLIAYLCSPRCNSIAATCVTVDGGFVAGT